MPTLRIERVPIQVFNLGLFGFDHLQLVYEQDRSSANQAAWYVLEGLRDSAAGGPFLGVEGTDGQTTISAANGGARDLDLIRLIGTPETRGSVIIPVLGGVTAAWETMASFGGSIDEQKLPYIGFGFEGSVTPTINSSSVVASLLFYAGIDIANYLPIGVGFSPGTRTLVGTNNDDELQIVNGFNALVGGGGNDRLEGGTDASLIERFLGGEGNDKIAWSSGFNLIHGGQPRLEYELDGDDTVDYTGVGLVTIDVNNYAIPHLSPEYIATHSDGVDNLFSIEGIDFNPDSDTIVLGEGVELILDDLTLKLDTQDSTGKGDAVSFKDATAGLIINAAGGSNYFVQGVNNPTGSASGIWLDSAEWIEGSQGGDKIYAGKGARGLEGNAGDDIIDARGADRFTRSQNGYDIQIFGGEGNDTIISGRGVSVATGGAGADRFVLSVLTEGKSMVEFVITDAGSSDRLFAPHEFFTETYSGLDGSTLLPILGGFTQFPGDDSFADLPQNLGPWRGGPSSRSDYAFYEWQTQDQRWNSDNQTQGAFEFEGAIFYNRDGGDLLIHVFYGYAIEVTEPGYAEQDWTHIINSFDPRSETIIRVKDFQEGDLGIQFHDLGDGNPVTLPPLGARPISAVDYPAWDKAVATMTANGTLAPAIELRPEAPVYDPNKSQQGDAPQLVSGTSGNDSITFLVGTATVEGGAGDDTIETSSGNDSIDGGSGADTMQGGAGNDTYIVDNAGDTVVESARQGNDLVRSKVSYTLEAFVERLELMGAAASGAGNDLANHLFGNGIDNLLRGYGGADILYGGLGNDTLDGGEQGDTYFYDFGDGNDTIIDAGGADGMDVLILHGNTASDVTFHQSATTPGDIIITINGGGRIVLDGFLNGNGRNIENIQFSDGTSWNRAEIERLAAASPVTGNDAPVATDDLNFGVRSGATLIAGSALTQNDSDFNGDALFITGLGSISSGIAVSLDPSGNILVTTPDSYEGEIGFTYTISDGNATDTANVNLTIIKNNTPVASGTVPGLSAHAGQEFSFTLPAALFSDTDQDVLTLAAHLIGGSDLPSWLTFSSSTGVFSGTPPVGSDGTLEIVVDAWDGAATASVRFAINIASDDTSGANSITGTKHHDVLTGTSAGDIIEGLEGNDLMRGLGGGDRFVIAGTDLGFDIYIGGTGIDRILGSAENDIIGLAGSPRNLSGIEIIDGGGGFDVLRFGSSGRQGPGSSDNIINLTDIELTGIELISAGGGDDRITGSHGDDRIRGGMGGDMFVFRGVFANDTIIDFNTGTTRSPIQDVINLRAFDFASFATVMANASEQDGSTLIDLGVHGSILLEGILMLQLKANDFVL